jgi:lipopolysaccharide transport system permease protein
MTPDTAERVSPDFIPDPGHMLREVVIEARSGWSPLNLTDLWAYRGLFFFLAWRDIKVRYKQTVLGAAWAVIQPVLSAIIFTLIFGQAAKLPSDNTPYLLFSYSGLILWTFFAFAMTQSSNSLVNSANLISKIYFPRLIIPIAGALVGLIDFAVAFVVLIGLMIYYRVPPTAALLLAPVIVAYTLVIALAVGIWLSALNVQYRDIRYTVPFLTQIGMFASPIVYAGSLTTGKLHLILALNPMTGVVEGFRWAMLGKNHVDGLSLVLSVTVTAVTAVSGLFYFRRVEQRFADVV